ncbi:thiamine pyrophosphate-requiring protein [Homoserinimonas sp. A520]
MGELTASDVLVDALKEAGVSIIFANFGSDHPNIIEALAKRRSRGENAPMVVLCPHETTAMSAAHGYAQATGMPQAVFVHVDVGTANLGGAVHNAARSRVPVLVFAGLTPYTLENELPGTRNSHINYLQDVHGQQDLVRPYVKWSYDIRTGTNLKQVVFRALQLASSSPQAPVYLTAAREVLAETVRHRELDRGLWHPITPVPAAQSVVDGLVAAMAGAQFPLIITSYLGRHPESVGKLVQFAEALGVAVVETTASQMNFPADHPLHVGYSVDEVIDQADVILAIDTDVPWVLSRKSPSPDAHTYFVDTDPLKEDLPLWYMPSQHFVRADSPAFLDQLLVAVQGAGADSVKASGERAERIAEFHRQQREAWKQRLLGTAASALTPEVVCDTINRIIDDRTIVLNETITSADTVSRYIPRTQPGTLFGNGGSSLGWSGGAAIGIKLANPESTVVSLIGDGTYLLTVPSSTYWVADQYEAPFLTVIFDNGGWNATKQNLIKQYPGGVADTTDQYFVNLAQSADLAGIASVMGGAFSATVTTVSELESTLLEALGRVKAGQPAAVTVRLDAISNQQSDAR